MMEISGAQMLIKAMEDQGVEKIFGYPGGAVLEIYDALEKAPLTISSSETNRVELMPPVAMPG